MHSDQRPIVVIGSINMDLVSSVPHIPGAGETILATDFQTHPGGKGANQAVGVARLGYPVHMIGMVGRDAFGDLLREQLKNEGVDVSEVHTVDATTGTATILVDPAGENSIVVAAGANLRLSPTVLREHSAVIRGAGVILAQLEIPLETVLSLAEMCANANIPLILDPAPARGLPLGTLKGVTWLTPNETETRFYAGDASSDDEILSRLFATGAKGAILKRGSLGSVVYGEDRVPHRVPAQAVKAVDTTAAGDAFNAAFAVGLMNRYDAIESAQFASAAAAVSVTRAGAQPSLATREEVFAVLGSAWKPRGSHSA